MPAARRAPSRAASQLPARHEFLYVESSAVLRVLLEGDGPLTATLRRFTRFFTSSLTLIEVPRVVARARREERLTHAAYVRAQRRLQKFAANCTIVEITLPVRDRAAGEFPVEPVRSLDAIHLATFLTHADMFAPIVVASCDYRVRDNARALGYDVVPEH